MKINKIIFLSALGFLLAASTCSAAWTIDNDYLNSDTGNTGTAYEPVASPTAGTYTSAQTVSLSATGDYNIRYTTDGSTPSCASGNIYSSVITVSSSQTIKAISCYNDNNNFSPSNVVSFAYAINIPASNGGGGGGGGGGSATTYCTSIVYSDWGTACIAGTQFRSAVSLLPSSCSMTTAQQLASQRACQAAQDISTSSVIALPVVNANILEEIKTESEIISSNNLETLLGHLDSEADNSKEQKGLLKYKTILGLDKKISADEKTAINDFIVYGTKSTQILGAGERAAVINSYYQAHKKLPNSETEWSDVLKISIGRWPSERNTTFEAQAKAEFKKVYNRNAVLTKSVDENAIMVIAYGLLPAKRNLASEAIAIKSFSKIYRHAPLNALAWNIVRAIAYSGATR